MIFISSNLNNRLNNRSNYKSSIRLEIPLNLVNSEVYEIIEAARKALKKPFFGLSFKGSLC
ncbi:MAG: hypothetical protein US62_C0006G0023 [Candidatus Woesebacteria bacterium GW2011_GWA1_37_8]|uniref:Uncharacterized protein n=1 Tax=Candidatus Woesebacteria bacterium GW2011_GWA1_37_8 TaxID=1618546 RepID=A0A0G0HUQ6_9BACT|nr:MAG: hypothetical protein US39_C0004G0047 [Microgenomates group bacterium GW2011_GWC1_37_12b]KKQ46012.1 MAG: hypothetical protein US62_C0006G0023 [Candidatus Woesebacteria bacterium GW2011_GWA1_37_8]